MTKKRILIICIIFLIVIFLAALAAFLVLSFYVPWSKAGSSLSQGRLIMQEQEDGRILVTWPEGIESQQYLFEIIDPQTRQTVYSCQITGQTSRLINPLPDKRMTLRVSTVVDYTVPFSSEPRQRIGQRLTVTDNLSTPTIQDISWIPDPNTDQVMVELALPEGTQSRMYTLSDQQSPVATLADNRIVLSFGEGKGYPIPADGQRLGFAFDAFREGENYIFHSKLSDPKYLVRSDLMDTALKLTYQDNGDNIYTLTWNETFAHTYRLEARLAGTELWHTLTTVSGTQVNSFTTEQLGILEKWEFRVVCPDTVPRLESPSVSFRTGASLRYSTIWPIKDLTVYSDSERTAAIGVAYGAQAFCVLALENGMFRVRFADTYGYIDSNYCMINLPQYLGDLCLYKITNSYQSLYKAHDYDIPNVTGTLVTGYEQVMLGENEYLVPLLYPVAKKLEVAAVDALSRGYKLLIYDSFRPQSATAALHDLALNFAQTMVPTPEPDPENPDAPVPPPMTFGDYMTDFYRYTLGNFIAKGQSKHNLGIALDLTLVAIDPATMNPEPDPNAPPLPEGEEPVPTVGPDGELIMQTPIHDLTWYSERKQNNANAQLLREIMESAGFGGIASEWWHYQDNDTRATFAPPPLWSGVTPEGWVTDDGENWRYRDQFGKFLTNCTECIDGEFYVFNADGYAVG